MLFGTLVQFERFGLIEEYSSTIPGQIKYTIHDRFYTTGVSDWFKQPAASK